MSDHSRGKQLRSTVRPDSTLEITLVDVATPEPGSHEVVLRVEAAPINPSDLGLLFAGADVSKASASTAGSAPVVTLPLGPGAMQAMAMRLGQSLPVGNEGAGVVVAAGASPEAQALLGRTVAANGGAMYSQYRTVPLAACLPLPVGVSPEQGASCFVNPLTALGMTETMRREGHTAIVHTAAASNLGQMLVKLCKADGIPLVNVVRRPEQVTLLRGLGAEHVCEMSSPTFIADLTQAIDATGATIAFDAIGGGRQGGQILTAMEAAAIRKSAGYSRYGSNVFKQLYIYGGLDTNPTEFVRSFGLAWSVGGWLLTPFLEKAGPEVAQRLLTRVASEITTTFASSYSKVVSLAEALDLANIAAYGARSTGGKYLINPAK